MIQEEQTTNVDDRDIEPTSQPSDEGNWSAIEMSADFGLRSLAQTISDGGGEFSEPLWVTFEVSCPSFRNRKGVVRLPELEDFLIGRVVRRREGGVIWERCYRC